MKDFSAFTIPLKEAQEWTKQWQSSYSKLPKAFTLPVEDLLGCLTEMGIINTDSDGNVTIKYNEGDKVRTYLGEDKDWNKKLIMVGTKNEEGTYVDIIRDAKAPGNSGIYDYSEPCPPKCDPKSPLN